MDWQVEYYKKENGHIPVLDYLLLLDAKTRAKAFSEVELLERVLRYRADFERRCEHE